MTNNYIYTLQDLYKIFQQAEDKVAQLREFQSLNLEYRINWDNLISRYVIQGLDISAVSGRMVLQFEKEMIMTKFEVRKTLAPYGFQVIDNTTDTVLETFKRKYQANAHAFFLGQTTMKTVTNLMTGKDIQIAENTPRACDPSSELYWSM